MLDEFILEQLGNISRKKEELGRQLRELTDEEDGENARITQLLHVEDVGKEIFSPRGSGEPLKAKIDGIRRHIDELLLREAQVKDELEQTASREEQYRQMLAEAQSGELEEGEAALGARIRDLDLSRRRREELEIILKRLDDCASCARVDGARCAAELENLQYYVKALLSEA